MKLFSPEKVEKFFNILEKLGRVCENRYKGYDKRNPHIFSCEKEIFVKRTLNKWLKNKLLILYTVSEESGVEYKQFLSINSISFLLGWGTKLTVNIYDYSRPMDFWNNIEISYNTAISLEGEWCENPEKHNQILKLTVLDIPEKEYIFETVEMDNYPKRRKKGQTQDDIWNSLKGEISFKARTEKEAWKKKAKFEKENKTKLVIQPKIIKIL